MASSPKAILIVEDEVSLLHILTDKLNEIGYDTVPANNGEDGLQLALQRHPDLILLDVLLPKLDGMSMLSKLRQDEWGKTVPVIVLTNVSPDREEQISSINKTQPAYYLIKSNNTLENVVEKVKDLLSQTTESNN